MDDDAPDYRSDRMESAEGHGRARAAWLKWAALVNRATGGMPETIATRIGAAYAVDLLGFWLVWQMEGGFAGLERLGMGRTTIFRKIKRFRQFTGQHPDDFELAGVTLDVAAYWKAASNIKGTRPQRKR